MMYTSLKYYVLRAWSLGLSGNDVVDYVCRVANVDRTDVIDAIQKLSMEMSG